MKILNCPFCGAMSLFGHVTAEWLDDTTAAVHCKKCAAYGPYGKNLKEATERWNNWWYASEGMEK